MVKNVISILVTDYIQKRRGQALLFSFEYNLLPNLISNFNHYMDRAYVLSMMIQVNCYFTIFLPHFELLLYFALKLDSLSPIKWVRKEKTSFFDISGLALKRSMHSKLWKNDGRPIGEPRRGIQK